MLEAIKEIRLEFRMKRKYGEKLLCCDTLLTWSLILTMRDERHCLKVFKKASYKVNVLSNRRHLGKFIILSYFKDSLEIASYI